jgi:hypothetical protein
VRLCGAENYFKETSFVVHVYAESRSFGQPK